MTRREGLAALLLMFCLFTAGLAWQFGAPGLICAALIGACVVVFGFKRVEKPRADDVRDVLPPDLVAAFERGLP